MFVSPLRCAKM